jgi:hypothetical protein
MASQCMLRLTLPCAQVAQAVLRHTQACLPSTQVKAAAAHVQILNGTSKKKVESDLSGNWKIRNPIV